MLEELTETVGVLLRQKKGLLAPGLFIISPVAHGDGNHDAQKAGNQTKIGMGFRLKAQIAQKSQVRHIHSQEEHLRHKHVAEMNVVLFPESPDNEIASQKHHERIAEQHKQEAGLFRNKPDQGRPEKSQRRKEDLRIAEKCRAAGGQNSEYRS